MLSPKQLTELAELINNQLAKHWLEDKRVQVVRLTVQGNDPGRLYFCPCDAKYDMQMVEIMKYHENLSVTRGQVGIITVVTI